MHAIKFTWQQLLDRQFIGNVIHNLNNISKQSNSKENKPSNLRKRNKLGQDNQRQIAENWIMH